MDESPTIATTIQPPYYAVIFTVVRTSDDEGYVEMAKHLHQLVSGCEGYLGMESAQEGDLEITVSYWASEQAILAWKHNVQHQSAQQQGKKRWYRRFKVRVAKVERDYEFNTEGESCNDSE